MREKYVRGGTDEVCPFLLREEEMPRKGWRKLTDVQALELFDMVRKGFSNKDIAKKFGITESTVGTYYRRVLSERSKESQRNGGGPRLVVIRGLDKLTFDVDAGYVGTFHLGDGMVDECAFKANDDADATIQYDEWREKMKAEKEFMDRIERKHDEPVDEDAAYIATWDTASAASILRDYSDGKLLRDVDRDTDVAIACEERDTRIKELEAKVAKKDVQRAYGTPSGTVYALVAVRPGIKGYGAYQDMDAAFAELDRLNEVASMLGADGAFEVHEMEWRG